MVLDVNAPGLPAHGHAFHTNRQRSVWLPAGSFEHTQGTRDWAVRGSAANVYEKFWALALDGSADELVMREVEMPQDWDLGAITPVIVWAPSDNSGGNVFWQVVASGVAVGAQMDITLEDSSQALFAAGTTAEARKDASLGTVTPVDPFFNFYVWRVASHALDTYDAHDVWFRGVRLLYTADM